MPKYKEYTKKQLELMYEFVDDFGDDENKLRMMMRLKQLIHYEKTVCENNFKYKCKTCKK